MKVSNFISNKGNAIKNQFIIENGMLLAFQSYETLICVYNSYTDTLYLDENKYSSTTSKYTNSFIEECNPMKIKKVDNRTLHMKWNNF